MDIDCWFHSPYISIEDGTSDKDRSIEKMYICEHCLRYFLNSRKYRQHLVRMINDGNSHWKIPCLE